MSLADRLVNELMLVSVLVAGQGAEALAAALEEAGAAAEPLTEAPPAEGFDLAILLAPPGALAAAAARATVDRLAGASDRLLLAPLPLGETAAGGPALPELPLWFEMFAELGYQPVIEFDASFVSPGAFLVDRAATAAEGDLAAFTDRLQMGSEAAAQQRAAVQDAERSVRTELQAARAALAATEAELATLRAEAGQRAAELAQANTRAARLAGDLEANAAALRESEARHRAWDGLRSWIRLEVAAAHRNEAATLLRDLPALRAQRPDLPATDAAPPQRGWRRLLTRRRPPAPHPALAEAALVRRSPLFDAAWYIASNPALHEGAALDPVLHYVLVGGPAGADPGPWFDTAAYLAGHPDVSGAPLAEAIRRGEVDSEGG